MPSYNHGNLMATAHSQRCKHSTGLDATETSTKVIVRQIVGCNDQVANEHALRIRDGYNLLVFSVSHRSRK